jgi:hypothetical protein
MGHVISSDQGLSSTRGKSLGTRLSKMRVSAYMYFLVYLYKLYHGAMLLYYEILIVTLIFSTKYIR